MTIKQSPLELKDCALLNFNCKFVAPKSAAKDVNIFTEYFEKYSVDVNFAITNASSDLPQVYVKSSINMDLDETKRLPGYEIYIECVGVFHINNEQITIEDKMNLLTNSAVVMVLNFLRTQTSAITASFIFGRYLLPSIDMKDLLEKKKADLEKRKSEKQKVTSKK